MSPSAGQSLKAGPGMSAGGHELRATGPWNDQWKAVDAKMADANLEDPQTLEIEYMVQAPPDPEAATEEGEAEAKLVKAKEIVYEDPGEADRPRLLVPLKSVLGLKQLCEREFVRIEQVTQMLGQCRTAYYKELLYLREQLILAADPDKALMIAFMQDYEVYYYDPPKYVDDDLKEFILNCNRWTNKRLIEENYELRMRIAGMDDVFANPDFCIKQLLKKLGPHKLMILLHKIIKAGKDIQAAPGTVATKIVDDEDKPIVLTPLQGLEAAVVECFPALKPKPDSSDAWRERVEELEKQIQDLKKKMKDSEEQAESQRKRAEDALAKVRDLDQKLTAAQNAAKQGMGNEAVVKDLQQKLASQEEKMKQYEQQGEGAARRIRKSYEELAKSKGVPIGTEPPALAGVPIPSLDSAVSSMEKVMKAVASMKLETDIVKDPTALAGNELALKKEINQLKQEITSLKEKLEAAEGNEQTLRAQVKDLEEKLSAKLKSAQSAPVADESSAEVERLRAQLAKKEQNIEELQSELDAAKAEAKTATKRAEDSDRLLQDKLRQDSERAKHMAELMAKLKASEDESDQLGAKLFRSQEKIVKLKEEVKQLKKKLGMEVKDSDDESSDEEDLPAFMVRYYVRTRNNAKPRWMLLSEDAKLSRQKKEWLSSNKFPSAPSQAQQALQFLRAAPSAPEQHRGPAHVAIESPWQMDPRFQGWQGLGMQQMQGPPQMAQTGAPGHRVPQTTAGKHRGRSPSPTQAPFVPTPLAPAATPMTQKAKAPQPPQNLQQIFEASEQVQLQPSHAPLAGGRMQTESQIRQPQQQLQQPVVRNLFPETQADDRLMESPPQQQLLSRPARQPANVSVPSSPAGAKLAGGLASGQKSRSPSPVIDRQLPSSGPLMVDTRREREDSQLSPTSVLSASVSSGRIDFGQSSWRSKDPPRSDGGSTRASENPTPAVSRGTPKGPIPPVASNRVSPPSVLRDDFANTVGVSATRSPGKFQARQKAIPCGTGVSPAQTSPEFRPTELADSEQAPVERSRRHLIGGGGSPAGMQSPSAAVLSWAGSGVVGSRSQSSLPLTNAPKSSLAKNRHGLGGGLSHSISNPSMKGPVEMVSSDTLPRLPGGKIRKEPAPPSWLAQS